MQLALLVNTVAEQSISAWGCLPQPPFTVNFLREESAGNGRELPRLDLKCDDSLSMWRLRTYEGEFLAVRCRGRPRRRAEVFRATANSTLAIGAVERNAADPGLSWL